MPKSLTRDQSPIRTIKKTMIVVTARDSERSLQVYLNSNIIPQKIEDIFKEGNSRPLIQIETELAGAFCSMYTPEERKSILGFLQAIGFEPENFKFPKDLPTFKEVSRSVENQEGGVLSDCQFEKTVPVERVWNFTSNARSHDRFTGFELAAFGEFLTNDDVLTKNLRNQWMKLYGLKTFGEFLTKDDVSTEDVRKEWMKFYGSKLPNQQIEFTDELMNKLGEHLCFNMDPAKKAEWIQRWANPGIDLSKE